MGDIPCHIYDESLAGEIILLVVETGGEDFTYLK